MSASGAEQLAVFKAAKQYSPHKSIDIVVANAGIAGYDPVSTWVEICPPLKVNSVTALIFETRRNRRTHRTRPQDPQYQPPRRDVHRETCNATTQPSSAMILSATDV